MTSNPQASNADSIYDLRKEFANSSITAGSLFQGTIDAFNGTQNNGQQILGGGFTLGAGAGADFSGGGTYTWVQPF